MGVYARNAVTVVLIAAGGLLVAYLIWVAATSKSFLAITLTSLVTVVVAFVLVVAVLAVIGVVAWWVAVLIGAASSIALLAALSPSQDSAFQG